MSRFFRLTLLSLLIVITAFGAHGADRIGVVDLEKVFREYHKSRAVEDFINQRAEAVRAYLKQMRGELELLRREMHKLGTEAGNPALSGSESGKLRQRADEAVRKVKAKEAEIQLYSTQVSREMRELENKKRLEIMADINAEIKRRSAVRGFNFILDRSGKTLNGQPALLYYPEERDITAEVIRELNRTSSIKKPTENKR